MTFFSFGIKPADVPSLDSDIGINNQIKKNLNIYTSVNTTNRPALLVAVCPNHGSALTIHQEFENIFKRYLFIFFRK